MSINSLMIALIICANLIALILDTLGIASSGVVPLVFGLSLIISIINSIILKTKLRVSIKSILLLIYILVVFTFSLLARGFDGATYKYMIMFLAYGGIIFLVTLMEFDSYKVIKYTMMLGILFLINPLKIAGYSPISTTLSGQISMGASYAFLPCVAAAIIHLFFYRDRVSLFIKVAYLANASLLFLLLKEATRGVLLSIIILCLYIYFTRIGIKQSRTRTLKIFGILLLMFSGSLLLIANLESVLINIYELMKRMGFEVSSIIKTNDLIQSEGGIVGILNGRGLIYMNALEMIKTSPIWGLGIGAYEDIYGTYQHNIFLQLFTEGGILLVLPISIIIIQCFSKLVKEVLKIEKTPKMQLLLMLFVISIPRLMISSYLWQEQTFWLLIFIFLKGRDLND